MDTTIELLRKGNSLWYQRGFYAADTKYDFQSVDYFYMISLVAHSIHLCGYGNMYMRFNILLSFVKEDCYSLWGLRETLSRVRFIIQTVLHHTCEYGASDIMVTWVEMKIELRSKVQILTETLCIYWGGWC